MMKPSSPFPAAAGLLLFWLSQPMTAPKGPPVKRVHVTESFLAGQALHRGKTPRIKAEAFRVGFAEVTPRVRALQLHGEDKTGVAPLPRRRAGPLDGNLVRRDGELIAELPAAHQVVFTPSGRYLALGMVATH